MIILVGVAGSGKSTQSKMLSKSENLQQLSIGELLRSKITGKQRQEMLEGKILDDDEVIGFLKQALQEYGDNPELILDGFPRSVGQAKWLTDQVESGKIHVIAVIHLNLDLKDAKERLIDRGRPDDHEPAISERFQEYEITIKPILKTLKDDGITVINISANQTEQKVHDDIVHKLQTITPKL